MPGINRAIELLRMLKTEESMHKVMAYLVKLASLEADKAQKAGAA